MFPFARRALPRAAIAFLAFVAGCEDDTQKEIKQVRDGPATTDFRPTPTAERLGFTANPAHGHDGSPHGGASKAQGFAWKTPEGWEEKRPPGQMREADFRLTRDQEVECYLSVVQGGIGQNVERWYKQMKIAPPSPAAIAALPKSPFLGQAGIFVDLEGTFVGMGRGEPKPSYRMLGLVVEEPGRTVTLKMTGPTAVVAEERERFLALGASFAAKAAPAHESPEREASLAWDAPPEWEMRQGHQMREVTFAPKGSEGTECWVTILQGTGGGVDANIQLWRQQMGQPALSAAELAALETVKVLDTDAKFIAITGDYTDMMGNKAAKAGMLGVVCQLPGALVTIKMTGPAEVTEKEKDRFLVFCRSLRTP